MHIAELVHVGLFTVNLLSYSEFFQNLVLALLFGIGSCVVTSSLLNAALNACICCWEKKALWQVLPEITLCTEYHFIGCLICVSVCSEERMRNGCKKIVKSRQGSTQGRLDSFFTVTGSLSSKRKVQLHKYNCVFPKWLHLVCYYFDLPQQYVMYGSLLNPFKRKE